MLCGRISDLWKTLSHLCVSFVALLWSFWEVGIASPADPIPAVSTPPSQSENYVIHFQMVTKSYLILTTRSTKHWDFIEHLLWLQSLAREQQSFVKSFLFHLNTQFYLTHQHVSIILLLSVGLQRSFCNLTMIFTNWVKQYTEQQILLLCYLTPFPDYLRVCWTVLFFTQIPVQPYLLHQSTEKDSNGFLPFLYYLLTGYPSIWRL